MLVPVTVNTGCNLDTVKLSVLLMLDRYSSLPMYVTVMLYSPLSRNLIGTEPMLPVMLIV